MNYLIRGIHLAYGRRELRPYVWKPLLISLGITLLTLLAFVGLFSALFGGWLSDRVPVAREWGTVGGAIVALVISILIFNPLFFTVAVLASALRWEALSRETEELVRGDLIPDRRWTFRQGLFDGWRRMPFGIAAGVVATIMGFVGLGWLGIGLVAWFATIDVTGPAFARRGVLFPAQVGPTLRTRGWASFWVGTWVVSLFPILNVLMLPALVAGGTLMVAETYPGELRNE